MARADLVGAYKDLKGRLESWETKLGEAIKNQDMGQVRQVWDYIPKTRDNELKRLDELVTEIQKSVGTW